MLLSGDGSISDVKFLFQVLKHSYAGYLYFGDFEKWENVRNNMINQKTILSYSRAL